MGNAIKDGSRRRGRIFMYDGKWPNRVWQNYNFDLKIKTWGNCLYFQLISMSSQGSNPQPPSLRLDTPMSHSQSQQWVSCSCSPVTHSVQWPAHCNVAWRLEAKGDPAIIFVFHFNCCSILYQWVIKLQPQGWSQGSSRVPVLKRSMQVLHQAGRPVWNPHQTERANQWVEALLAVRRISTCYESTLLL